MVNAFSNFSVSGGSGGQKTLDEVVLSSSLNNILVTILSVRECSVNDVHETTIETHHAFERNIVSKTI